MSWGGVVGSAVKVHQTHEQQLAILKGRGMDLGDPESAAATLQRVNYYRLSGYWYPFRRESSAGREDDFRPGTRFSDVVALYEFDMRLRAASFAALAPVELAVRAHLGHELGRIDPQVHLNPDKLGPTARRGNGYDKWLKRYKEKLERSREDFVLHHRDKYDGQLPIWVTVDLLDWGSLSNLYGFASRDVQNAVAGACGLSAPQLTSWLRVLNLLRNTCAHHGRLFNRVHAITPKMPSVGRQPELDAVSKAWSSERGPRVKVWSRTFGQLTLVQFLLMRLGAGRSCLLPAVVLSFPSIEIVPITQMGVPHGWRDTPLWG